MPKAESLSTTAAQAAAFIAACLAPLPADSEPANTQEFLRQIKRDRLDVWRRQMLRTKAIELYCKTVTAQRILASFDGGAPVTQDEGFGRYVLEVDRQMQIPAPSLEALRWKRSRRAIDKGRPQWDASIAADEARLGVVA